MSNSDSPDGDDDVLVCESAAKASVRRWASRTSRERPQLSRSHADIFRLRLPIVVHTDSEGDFVALLRHLVPELSLVYKNVLAENLPHRFTLDETPALFLVEQLYGSLESLPETTIGDAPWWQQ